MPFDNFLEVVTACDKVPFELDPNGTDEIHQAAKFRFGAAIVGFILPSVLPELKTYNESIQPAPFVIDTDVQFSPWVDSLEKRTEVFKHMLETWRKNNVFETLKGWRDELYAVYGDDARDDYVLFAMERSATPLFGVCTYGSHLNAYTIDADGEIKVWVSRRAKSKQTWPGYLDNCVAGGIPYMYNATETIIKECEEEASIPSNMAEKGRNVSCVSYFNRTKHGFEPETEYVFDLQLPLDFKPTPRDGEVECFYLWSLNKIKETLLQGEWKEDSAIVMIDFLIRHGFITADADIYYTRIIHHLHRRLTLPVPHTLVCSRS